MHADGSTTFSQWLKRRRQELGLTQDRLAELVGYASPTIQKIERGERKPSRDLATRLADVLAIPDHERDAFLRVARSPTTPEATSSTLPALPPLGALPLLRTRIQPPPVRRHLVPRERLLSPLGAKIDPPHYPLPSVRDGTAHLKCVETRTVRKRHPKHGRARRRRQS